MRAISATSSSFSLTIGSLPEEGRGEANGERYGVRCVPKMEGEGREERGRKDY